MVKKDTPAPTPWEADNPVTEYHRILRVGVEHLGAETLAAVVAEQRRQDERNRLLHGWANEFTPIRLGVAVENAIEAHTGIQHAIYPLRRNGTKV